MAVLTRIVRQRKLWSRIDEPGWWEKDNFPHMLLRELEETKGGFSLWLMDSESDDKLERLAAAHVFRKSPVEFENTEFRFVTESELPRGVSVTATPGILNDDGLNSLHREIRQLTGPQAVELASSLQKPKIINKERIPGLVAKSILSGHIPRTDVNEPLLKLLHKYRLLKLLEVPEESS